MSGKKATRIKPKPKQSKQPKSKPELKVISVNGYLDRVWVSYGQTIQVRDFEPAKVDVGMASDVQPGESVEDAYDRVAKIITKKIKVEMKALIQEKSKQRRK